MEFGPWASITVHVKLAPETAAAEPLHVTVDTPERLSFSLPLRPIETVLRLIVDPFGGDAIVTVGGVLSSFTATDVLAVLPAISIAVPAMIWLAPSVETVWGEGQFSIPDVESLHVKVTVGFVLFQPAAFGAGETTAVMVGEV